jgi:putative spermidine/putrescine transport system permease protein
MAAEMKNLGSKLILIITAIFIFFPLYAAAEFSMRNGAEKTHGLAAYRWIFEQAGFAENLAITARITVLAVVLNLLIMVPTVTWLHLSGQRYKRLVEILTILPLIIPVVALATGAQLALPSLLENTVYELSFMYVVIAMPYTYRALDIGLSGHPLATLTNAARNLGASWIRVLTNVIVPTIRPSIFAALFLMVALSLGEFTLAQLLHWTTFPVWVTNVSQQNIIGATALAIGSLFFAWLLLFGFTFFGGKNSNTVQEEA